MYISYSYYVSSIISLFIRFQLPNESGLQWYQTPYLLTIRLSTVVDCEHMCNILLPCKDTQLILLWCWCICTDLTDLIMSCSRLNESIQSNKNEDICCGCVSFVLNDAPQSDGYRVEVQYTQYFYILDERIRTVRSQDCCKLFIAYLPFWCYCNIIH